MSSLAVAAGVAGSVLYLTSFALVQRGRVAPGGAAYALLNVGASAGMLLSLTEQWNLGVALTNTVWLALSIDGIRRAGATRPSL